MAARQNHTDAGVTSIRKTSEKILTEVELSREDEEERAEKLDQRLEKIEKKVAKLAPVNMAKTIENAMSACMEKMVDQLTDRVVKRFEDMAEESRKKDEIRRGKQVEATPEEEEMSDIEFEPGATFSVEENKKVERAIREEMEVDVTAQAGTKIFGDKKGRLLVVSEEWCYRKTETLEDAEEATRWWRYNLVR